MNSNKRQVIPFLTYGIFLAVLLVPFEMFYTNKAKSNTSIYATSIMIIHMHCCSTDDKIPRNMYILICRSGVVDQTRQLYNNSYSLEKLVKVVTKL